MVKLKLRFKWNVLKIFVICDWKIYIASSFFIKVFCFFDDNQMGWEVDFLGQGVGRYQNL